MKTRAMATNQPAEAGSGRSTPDETERGRPGTSSQTDPLAPFLGGAGGSNPDHRPKPAEGGAPVLEWFGMTEPVVPDRGRSPSGRYGPRYSVMLTVISDTLRPPPAQLWTPSVAPYVLKTLLEHKRVDSLPVGTCEVLEPGQLALLLGERGAGASQDVAREVADAVSCDEWPWVGGPYLFKGEAVVHRDVRDRVRACKRKRQRVSRRWQRAGTDLPRLPPDSLKYRKGSTNVVADALSRPPSAKDLGEPVTLPQEAVAQLLDYVSRREMPVSTGLDRLCVQKQAEKDETTCCRVAAQAWRDEETQQFSTEEGETTTPSPVATTAFVSLAGRRSPSDWVERQRSDPFLNAVLRYLSVAPEDRTAELFADLTGPDNTGDDPDLVGSELNTVRIGKGSS